MKPNSYASAFLILMLIIGFGCVTEIDFRTNGTGIPVVSGIISNSPDQRTISIFETVGIGEENIPIPSSGRMYVDGTLATELEEVEPGQLKLPESYVLTSGPEYYFEITTNTSRTFQTIPQRILPVARTQSLEWERTSDLIGENSNGEPKEINLVDIYANIEIEANQDTIKYFRWQVSDTWLFREIPRPFVDTFVVIDSERMLFGGGWTYDTMIVFEPDTVKDCFPTNDVDQYSSILLETTNLSPGKATVKVMRKEIDQSFLFKHYFSVFLHRIDQRAFEYYSKAQSLIGNQGTLYDEVPAVLLGNIFDVNDPNARVLGYVELSFPDTIRMPIAFDQLNLFFEDGCRPRTGPFACKGVRSPSGAKPPPCKCYACDSVFGLETDIKPDYWE